MGKLLTSVLTIVVTLTLMGIGTYVYLTTPKTQIDNTSPYKTTNHLVPPLPNSNNSSDNQLLNDTRIQSLENQHENNITISK